MKWNLGATRGAILDIEVEIWAGIKMLPLSCCFGGLKSGVENMADGRHFVI